MYQHLVRHFVNVQTFPEPILYMAGIVGRWEGSPLLPEIMHAGKSMYNLFDCKIGDLSVDIHFFSYVVVYEWPYEI